MKKPLVLTIIDGLGINPTVHGNAFRLAKTPVLSRLLKEYPNTTLKAAGPAVGLPEGQMGNSEVGHLNIGAGEIVYTGLSLVNKALLDGSFYNNKAILKVVEHAKKNHSRIHVMGLLSEGGVHSLEEHLYAVLELLHRNQVTKVSVHVFGDGRDVAPESITPSLTKLIAKLKAYHFDLASIQGRIYAMDRDKNFDKTQTALDALQGHAKHTFTDPITYVQSQYTLKITDEFLEPAIAKTSSNLFLSDNDGVIFFNFRPDRARQLTHFLIGSNLYEAQPQTAPQNVVLASMMKYEGIEKAFVAFDAMDVPVPLGKVLADAKLKQLRIAETQKYAHVTFFLDGGMDIKYPGEERILIPSLKLDNFALSPQMSAIAITDALLPVLSKFDVVIMNYANPDMVGHTGDLNAAIKAVEVVDTELGRLHTAVEKLGGVMFITADHGNAEIMIEKDGTPATKHTTSDVFLICTDRSLTLTPGALCNIAPTILKYLKLPIPKSMIAKPLI